MRGTYYKLDAVVLKRKEFKENDLAVTVYSRQKGKLNLVIKGGKNITSKLAGHVEPLSLVELNVVATRGDRDQIIGAQLERSYWGMAKDVNKLGYANYFLEMVDGLTKEGEGEEKIFLLLVNALDGLQNVKVAKDLSLVRILFVFKLLYLLGFRPDSDDPKINQLVKIVVESRADETMNHKEIKLNQKKLFEISQQSLAAQLNQPLKSEKFIRAVNQVGLKVYKNN